MAQSRATRRIEPDDLGINRRDVDEFLGICRGVIADGHVSDEDFRFLLNWVQLNRGIAYMPVVSEICDLVDQYTKTGNTTDAQQSLLDALSRLTGGSQSDGSLSTSLPLTEPPPPIIFSGKRFCFTGEFRFGTRTQCETAIVERGADMRDSLTVDTDYLVVGTLAADGWIHSSYGTKITRAVEWRANKKRNIPIVSEEHWAEAVALAPLSPVPGTKPLTRTAVFRREEDSVTQRLTELYDREAELSSEEFDRLRTEITGTEKIIRVDMSAILEREAKHASPSALAEPFTNGGTGVAPRRDLSPVTAAGDGEFLLAAEAAGRRFARRRRLPWYVLPVALFLLSFAYVGGQIAHHNEELREVSATSGAH